MSWNPLLPGSPVCVCHRIGHDQCRDLVFSGAVKNLADLKRCTPAGSNCALCEPYFESIIEMYLDMRSE